jgi:hypothetical protein
MGRIYLSREEQPRAATWPWWRCCWPGWPGGLAALGSEARGREMTAE